MTATDGAINYYDHGQNGPLNPGDMIDFDGHGLDGSVTVRFIHIPSNSLLGTYKVTSVSP